MDGRSPALEMKYARLRDALQGMGNVAVAFSGGVDSSLLLKVACDELGEGAVALTAVSPLMTKRELESAVQVADEIGVSMIQVPSGCLDDDAVASNPKDRCYWCKMINLGSLRAKAGAMGFGTLADGTNADDLKTARPGLRSLLDTGTVSPLAEAGMTKEDVRELARSLGLSNWNKPSDPCLATRIPYGERITLQKLARVEKAEDAIRSMGFTQVRVRMHGELARIELDRADIHVALSMMDDIASAVRAAGFRFVTLDLEGYRSGGMDG